MFERHVGCTGKVCRERYGSEYGRHQLNKDRRIFDSASDVDTSSIIPKEKWAESRVKGYFSLSLGHQKGRTYVLIRIGTGMENRV